MTLTLILTRHAKSDWDDPLQDDHDRPLNPRGRHAATAMGQWLAEQQFVPDTMLCSSAARTRETCERLSAAFRAKPHTVFLPSLYLSGAQIMLDQLRQHGAGKTVMMITHNPGTAIMAEMLADGPVHNPDFRKYPTCFTTVFQLKVDAWSEADWGMGHVTCAIGPRELG